MSKRFSILKALTLAAIGFLIPFAFLLPIEYAVSEFEPQKNWGTVFFRYLPPSLGCCLLFHASSITSSTPKKIVTFVQSLFLHGATFIIFMIAFVPIQRSKSSVPQAGPWGWIPLVAVFLVFVSLLLLGNLPITTAGRKTEAVATSQPDKKDA